MCHAKLGNFECNLILCCVSSNAMDDTHTPPMEGRKAAKKSMNPGLRKKAASFKRIVCATAARSLRTCVSEMLCTMANFLLSAMGLNAMSRTR